MITLRRTCDRDLPAIYAWYTASGHGETTGSVVSQPLGSFVMEYTELIHSPNARCFTVWEQRRRIGLVEIRGIGRHGGPLEGEAVLMLGERRHRGIGIALMAVTLEYAMEILRLERLWWWVDSSNQIMLRICSRLGFPSIASGVCGLRSVFAVDALGYRDLLSRTALGRTGHRIAIEDGGD